jgi:hypothetical protein
MLMDSLITMALYKAETAENLAAIWSRPDPDEFPRSDAMCFQNICSASLMSDMVFVMDLCRPVISCFIQRVFEGVSTGNKSRFSLAPPPPPASSSLGLPACHYPRTRITQLMLSACLNHAPG